MANQTISVDTNHDAATGRLAGEDFTINSGATLTIDSMPHLTAMGILGDITLSDGTLHIDGTRTYEVAYSNGSGSLPAIGTEITWNGGTDSGKIIQFNSGTNVTGVATITKNVGAVTPDDTDIITGGGWTADLDSVKIGFLIVFGEDQDYGGVDGRSTLRITGDWYEVGVGTGADSQTVTLPHTGHQHAVWVETGNGTNVFEIWHRISSGASTVFYDTFTEFGTHWESGKVFQQAFGSSTLTFGTTTNGGAPPSGARIRIPNVHMGTTTTAAPTTEQNSTTLANHVNIIPPNTTTNIEIDHLNASSIQVGFIGTGPVTVSDSAFGLATTLQNKVLGTTLFDNCAFIQPSVNTVGGLAASVVYTMTDSILGTEIRDCVFYGGTDSTTGGALVLTTTSNVAFTGTNKIALSITDENTSYAIRASVTSNITAETLVLVGGGIIGSAGCNNWTIDDLRIGYPPGRGTTEQNQNLISLTGTQSWLIKAGNLINGGKWPTIGPFLLTDAFDTEIRNFGAPTAKVNMANRATYVISMAGITENVRLKRLWFDNMNGTQAYQMVNSVKNVLIENCSGEYTDEIETDANDVLVKGLHGASGAPDAATGVEGDNVGCIGSVFLDYFKSNTTGALGLTFQDPGTVHATDVEITAGTPIFNGLGDLLMRTNGDQVVYTWPYTIKGHTAFQNAAVQTSAVGTYTYEYSIDTGSGWSAWATANGANLSAETISPAGFKFRLRITCTASGTTNAIKGFAVLTNTTLADQAANLYPLVTSALTLTGLKNPTEVRVFDAGTTTEIAGVENVTSGTYTSSLDAGTYPLVDISILSLGYQNIRLLGIDISGGDLTIPIQQQLDRQYQNA